MIFHPFFTISGFWDHSPVVMSHSRDSVHVIMNWRVWFIGKNCFVNLTAPVCFSCPAGDLPGQSDHLGDPVLVWLYRVGGCWFGGASCPDPAAGKLRFNQLSFGDSALPGASSPPGRARRGLSNHGHIPGGADRLLHSRPQHQTKRICLDLPGDQRRPVLPDGLPRRGVREQVGGKEAGTLDDGGFPQDFPQHAQRWTYPQERLVGWLCRGLVHPWRFYTRRRLNGWHSTELLTPVRTKGGVTGRMDFLPALSHSPLLSLSVINLELN